MITLTRANFLELPLGIGILQVFIGMMLQTELPIGFLDLGRIRIALNAQDPVEVAAS